MKNKLLASIEAARKELDISERALMAKAGLKPDAVRNSRGGKAASPRLATLVALSEATGWFIGQDGREVVLIKPPKIVGAVGAGAEIVWIDDYDNRGDLEDAPAVPGLVPGMVAVRVIGDSMWPAFKPGDLLYYAGHAADWEDYLGKECVVKLRGGAGFVKVLQRGSKRGRYSLASHNAAPMEDQAIDWISPVLAVFKAK